MNITAKHACSYQTDFESSFHDEDSVFGFVLADVYISDSAGATSFLRAVALQKFWHD